MKISILTILIISLTSMTTLAQSRVNESIENTKAQRFQSRAEAIDKIIDAQKRLDKLKIELEAIDNPTRKKAKLIKYATLAAAATSVVIAVYAYKSANTTSSYYAAENMGYLTFYATVSALVTGVTAGGAAITEIQLTTEQIKELEVQIESTQRELWSLKAELKKLK